MINFPEIMPEYKITKSDKAAFSVKWEELMGWFIVPKLGEKLSWAIYEFPEKKRREYTNMSVIGKAVVHGIEGVEIIATEHKPMEFNSLVGSENSERHFVAQLSDTHCRILSESHYEGDIKHYYTFLDADEFIPNWGFGEDNCGNEINLKEKNLITRNGSVITSKNIPFLIDITGRYTIEIAGKSYDTVCVMDIDTYNPSVASEQYLDKNGRTILWRRYNRNDWAFSRYKQKWSEKLPENERITINGELYIHWYDCITDYIL